MNPQICHVIQELSRGGAARATMFLAKHSQKTSPYRHTIISLKPADPHAVQYCNDHGIGVLSAPDRGTIEAALRGADIVQVSWWNNPEIQAFLQSALPEMRLVGWFHVGGDALPQVVSNRLVEFVDRAVACSPYTYRCNAFRRLSPEVHARKAALVYGATDFDRLMHFAPRAHQGFAVGYIGTLDFVKIHPQFVAMNAAARVPGKRVIVRGHGGAVGVLQAQAQASGAAQQFEFMGYADDVAEALAEFDVFGYPLCENTYAASEMVLQEAMYCGLPAVVFPYGGIQDLVVAGETALVVSSPAEYAEAIEYLYHRPDERRRIGTNAQRYAAATFGAANAAAAANQLYDQLLSEPKRSRRWQAEIHEIISGDRLATPWELFSGVSGSGAWHFIDSLGQFAGPFVTSLISSSVLDLFDADRAIAAYPEPMLSTGLLPYRNAFPECPFLWYWSGCSLLYVGRGAEAAEAFVQALQRRPNEWRFWSGLRAAASAAGHPSLAVQAEDNLQAVIRQSGHAPALQQQMLAPLFQQHT